MLWLALHFPALALEASPAMEGAARVVVDRQTVVLVDSEARRLGVLPGMSLASAYALASHLNASEYGRDDVVAALEHLAPRLGSVTSHVGICPDGSSLVGEIGASERLFGGLPGVLEAVAAAFVGASVTMQVGVASTPLAAEVLATYRPGAVLPELDQLRQELSPLPVAALPWSEAVSRALTRMGVRTIGQVLTLPRDGLARRLGVAAVDILDRVLGARSDPRASWTPPDIFVRSASWDFPAPSAESLLFPLRRILGDLSAHVSMRGECATEWALRLDHDDAAPEHISVRAAQGTTDILHMLGLTQDRLRVTSWPAPVTGLQVRLIASREATGKAGSLFDDRANASERAQALIERLRARLGDEAVHGLSAAEDPRPERAQRRESAPPRPPAPGGPRRPAWLLAVPRPWHFDASRLLDGPERIEGGWWDGDDARRDYYLATGDAGETAWVYRDLRTGAWFVHGLFG